MRRLFAVLALGIIGCTNPSTPAGYVGYVTKHPYTMPARFYELQTGPTSTGLGWMLDVTNISVTPNTSTEQFVGPDRRTRKGQSCVSSFGRICCGR